jgi:hypothetical protein
MELLNEIFLLKYEERMTTIALLWCWWTERNKANHAERRFSINEMQFMVRRYTGEWIKYFKKEPTVASQITSKWQPPDVDWTMINIDGAFNGVSGKGGWGCVARDHASQPIFAAAGAISNAGEALRTETEALLHAISIAEQVGIGRPIFATDCQVLQQAVVSDKYDEAPLGALFREVKYQLRLAFLEHQVIYMHRSCNKPAHELAALGAAEPQGYHNVWVENYPNAVSRAMSGDYAVES